VLYACRNILSGDGEKGFTLPDGLISAWDRVTMVYIMKRSYTMVENICAHLHRIVYVRIVVIFSVYIFCNNCEKRKVT
jgi:hypothetical protein